MDMKVAHFAIGRMILGLLPILMVAGCVGSISWGDPEGRYINNYCKNDPLVGQTKGLKASIEAKKVKAEVGVERYNKIAQTLENYSVEWESLNRDVLHACRASARCQYHKRTEANLDCSEVERQWDLRTKESRDFTVKVLQLKAKGSSPNQPSTEESAKDIDSFLYLVPVMNIRKDYDEVHFTLEVGSRKGAQLPHPIEYVNGEITDTESHEALLARLGREPMGEESFHSKRWISMTDVTPGGSRINTKQDFPDTGTTEAFAIPRSSNRWRYRFEYTASTGIFSQFIDLKREGGKWLTNRKTWIRDAKGDLELIEEKTEF